ncbi:MAG: hypothetical protein KA260_08475 [Burkholderiales bacterium]|nr:hypothetical protein [Burkholderiales bacterium]
MSQIDLTPIYKILALGAVAIVIIGVLQIVFLKWVRKKKIAMRHREWQEEQDRREAYKQGKREAGIARANRSNSGRRQPPKT